MFDPWIDVSVLVWSDRIVSVDGTVRRCSGRWLFDCVGRWVIRFIVDDATVVRFGVRYGLVDVLLKWSMVVIDLIALLRRSMDRSL